MFLTDMFKTGIFMAPSDASSGGGESFFSPDSGAAPDESGSGAEQAAGDAAQGSGEAGASQDGGDRPDWLLPKYESVEAQAKAARELYGKLSTKTEALKAEVAAEWKENWAKEIGVPEGPDGYVYPEGVMAPSEEVDAALREWAKENNVSADGFQKLIGDVYAKTQANFEQEKAKLGETADARIETVNRWLSKNVDKEHFPALAKTMSTAEGFQMIEAIMKSNSDSGYMPETGSEKSGVPLTRDQIRELQADPRFGHDDGYTQMVRDHWKAYAARAGR